MLNKILHVSGLIVVCVSIFILLSAAAILMIAAKKDIDEAWIFAYLKTAFIYSSVSLVLGGIIAILFDKKPEEFFERSFDYPRPTSGDQIKSVYTPIEYVQAGEKLLREIAEKQNQSN